MTNSGIYSDNVVRDRRGKVQLNICGGPLYPPIHSDDDYFMTHVAGIRPSKIKTISFQKTAEEKKELAIAKRRSFNKISSSGQIQQNTKIEFKGRLIVYLKNTEVDQKKRNTFKTTHSFNCVKSDVNDILVSFRRKKLEIINYYFNY